MASTNLSVGIGTLTVDGVSVGWLKGDVVYSFQFETADLTVGRPQHIVAKAVSQPKASLKASTAEVSSVGIFLAFPATSNMMNTYNVVYETFDVPGKTKLRFEFPKAVVVSTSIKTVEAGYSMTEFSVDAIGDMPTITATPVNEDGTYEASYTFGGNNAPTYAIAYNPNGGSGGPSDSTRHTLGTPVSLLFSPAPAKSFSRFLGWSLLATDASPTYTSGGTNSITMPSHPVNLYAIYEVLYSVTYNANGGSGVPTDSNGYAEGDTVSVDFTTPTRTGYRFLGWSVSQSAVSPDYASGLTTHFTMDAHNVTLYAVYEALVHITYNANGGSGAPTDSNGYVKGSTVNLLFSPAPSKTGYSFSGWDLSPSAGSPGLTNSGTHTITLSSDTTLYAVYQKMFQVTYAANGGSNPPSDPAYYNNGDTVSVNFTAPTYAHHNFQGWDRSASAGVPQYSGGGTTTFSIHEDTTLYAIYQAVTPHAVFYNLNTGGGNTPSDSASYYPGDTVTVQFSPAPTKAGYNFLGWDVSASAGTPAYTAGGTTTFTMGSGQVTLYAIYQAIPTYSVTYNYNGGSGTTSDSNAYHAGDTVTVLLTDGPTKVGYTFLGWDTSASAVTPAYPLGSGATFTMPSSNVTLYAIYQAIPTYTVTYKGNGGTGVPNDPNNHPQGSTVTVFFGVTPTYAGHTFLGWDMNKFAATPSYTNNGVKTFTMPGNNVNLFAIYSTP